MAEAVIGTAGHVDHGKTALVNSLTGHDTDRLPEEKRRGVSIDLGFAPLDLPSGRRAGIVDVPGHERFVKNMVAGASGVDAVLLVVAADEGVMPQTREHLDILQLLGISAGLIVMTKIDLVDADWLDLVEEEIREAVSETFLKDSPIVKVSSRTGAGIQDLREAIDRMLQTLPPKPEDAHARLPIDRVFTIAGFGTVVTGTLVAGKLRTEDRLSVQPGDVEVRVRQLQVHGQPVETATAGQRVAVNVSGVSKESLRRGMVLATPGTLRAVRSFAASLSILPRVEFVVKNGARVRIHIGTSEVLGRCLLLDREEIQPGAGCFAQIQTEAPVAVARGDRFVLRRFSPMETFGGGLVLDPGRRYRRYRSEELATLAVLERGDLREIVETVVLRKQEPTAVARMADELNVPIGSLEPVLRSLVESRNLFPLAGGSHVWHRRAFQDASARIREKLEAFHTQNPLRGGISREALRREYFPETEAKVFAELLDLFAADGVLELRDESVCRPGYRPALEGRLGEAFETLAAMYASAGNAPPSPSEAVAGLDLKESETSALFELLVERERLVRVDEDLYFARATYRKLVTEICHAIEREGPLTVAEIRNLLGTSRKYVVPLLEHLDRMQVTRRLGDRRELTPRGRKQVLGGSL